MKRKLDNSVDLISQEDILALMINKDMKTAITNKDNDIKDLLLFITPMLIAIALVVIDFAIDIISISKSVN